MEISAELHRAPEALAFRSRSGLLAEVVLKLVQAELETAQTQPFQFVLPSNGAERQPLPVAPVDTLPEAKTAADLAWSKPYLASVNGVSHEVSNWTDVPWILIAEFCARRYRGSDHGSFPKTCEAG